MGKKLFTLVIVDNECHIEGISTWPTLKAAQKELKADFKRTIDDIVGEDKEDEDFLIETKELNDKSYYIAYGGQYELYAEIREYDMEPGKFDKKTIKKAEQVLIDNGIEADEASSVLQALGYVLLDEELYPEE